MALLDFLRKEKGIGAARKRHYDLPLNKDAGTGFLTLLIMLMAFLAMLALAASFALSAMTERWSSGLENKVTVEIPAEMPNGSILSAAEIRQAATRAGDMLTAHPAVQSVHIMTDDEIRELVKPWLGEGDLSLAKIPLPGLIALELQDTNPKTVKTLESKLKEMHPRARIDTHEEWLTDLIRFTGALQLAAGLLTLVIGLTMVTAVAGGVRSRMEVHKAEVELLHLMGASDNYISGQFQRHSLLLALRGAALGVLAGAAALTVIGWVSGEIGVSLLPEFKIGPAQIVAFVALPGVIALIATAAARGTVLKVLERLP